MQVGEQDVVRFEETPLGGLRLFHLDDELCSSEDVCGRLGDATTGSAVIVVGRPDTSSSIALDDDLVATPDELSNP